MEIWGTEHGVVLPVRARALSQCEVRAASSPWGEWRRSSHGRYVPRLVELTPSQRVAEAGVLLVPPSAITGWASLAWQRARWFTGLERDAVTPVPVDIAMSRRLIRPQPLIVLCEERFDPREVVVVDGLRVTNAVRSTCYVMRYAPHLRAAVRALSMACYNDHVSLEEVTLWVDLHPSYTGIEQCRQALPLGDENAWSPAEVDFGLDWTELTGRRPLMNRPLFDLAGRHLGTPDLIDPVTGVLGEYDSELHLEGSRRARDLEREGIFRDHGLHPVTMVTAERHDQAAFQHRVRAAYAAAERQRAAERRWTLEPPDWWVPTWTVAQRRALTAYQRERWLAHRAA
jgi:hypothetical protein